MYTYVEDVVVADHLVPSPQRQVVVKTGCPLGRSQGGSLRLGWIWKEWDGRTRVLALYGLRLSISEVSAAHTVTNCEGSTSPRLHHHPLSLNPSIHHGLFKDMSVATITFHINHRTANMHTAPTIIPSPLPALPHRSHERKRSKVQAKGHTGSRQEEEKDQPQFHQP